MKGGFKVSSCTASWYRGSCGTDFDNSEPWFSTPLTWTLTRPYINPNVPCVSPEVHVYFVLDLNPPFVVTPLDRLSGILTSETNCFEPASSNARHGCQLPQAKYWEGPSTPYLRFLGSAPLARLRKCQVQLGRSVSRLLSRAECPTPPHRLDAGSGSSMSLLG